MDTSTIKIYTSRTEANPGRKFYAKKDGYGQFKFIGWVDAIPDPRVDNGDGKAVPLHANTKVIPRKGAMSRKSVTNIDLSCDLKIILTKLKHISNSLLSLKSWKEDNEVWFNAIQQDVTLGFKDMEEKLDQALEAKPDVIMTEVVQPYVMDEAEEDTTAEKDKENKAPTTDSC